MNDRTLTVDLGTQGHMHLSHDLAQLWPFTSYKLDLGVDSNIFNVENLRNLRTNYLALMLDLGIEGQIHFCLTFPISDCDYHTDMIFMSILRFLRAEKSKMFK